MRCVHTLVIVTAIVMALHDSPSLADEGMDLYLKNCATCHEKEGSTAPQTASLNMIPGDLILRTLESGAMQPMAAHLTSEQRQEITKFLTGDTGATIAHKQKMCDERIDWFDYNRYPVPSGWGSTQENTRFIPAEQAQLKPDEVQNLRLKWSFAYPRATRARSQPTVAGGVLFVGSQDGTVYALDAETGCIHWTFRAMAEVRTGITIPAWNMDANEASIPTGYFADILARVYAVNLLTGEMIWVAKADNHPAAAATAQPVYHNGVVYQPVSSMEAVSAAATDYPCCTFRGSIIALNAKTGAVLWKSYSIPQEPQESGMTSAGTRIFAPSGAPIWNSPTVDVNRMRLYSGTGENYSSPAQGSSDAIIAFDVKKGKIIWVRQTLKGDAWNMGCMPYTADKSNCPIENGPDQDLGAPPVLVRTEAGDVLVAGQKNGNVFGIDPEDGTVLWQRQASNGGIQGGIHFGMAAAGNVVFVPISDFENDLFPHMNPKPGLRAINATTGDELWFAPANNICGERKYCSPGISAPVTAIPGVVFAGHMDGFIRAYDANNGSVLWEYDTYRSFRTISGEEAFGGSIGGGTGPIIANGMLYVNSGYGIYFHMPGNVLLAFEIPPAGSN